jgi:predicted methyltransferase
MKRKKMKKLEELKKKNQVNLQKIKEVHEISGMEVENAQEDECVICRKSGGNLVWISKMAIRNLEKLYQLGSGTLTLSFTSCYHLFD